MKPSAIQYSHLKNSSSPLCSRWRGPRIHSLLSKKRVPRHARKKKKKGLRIQERSRKLVLLLRHPDKEFHFKGWYKDSSSSHHTTALDLLIPFHLGFKPWHWQLQQRLGPPDEFLLNILLLLNISFLKVLHVDDDSIFFIYFLHACKGINTELSKQSKAHY